MPRLPRFDAPGRWFHVMNRGIARRVVFRCRADMRVFLALVAHAVRRGQIEVHAFVLLATHFHLLVRSPSGLLSEAMRRIQNEYVRHFNRTNRRDGPLFRGRFRSRPVLSLHYRRVLVRYIDDNPVAARLVTKTTSYPHGSAHRHSVAHRPLWLAGWWIDESIAEARRVDPGASYASVWGRAPSEAERELVRERLHARPRLDDDLDDLLRAAPAAVLAWMRRKAALADGTTPGTPLVAPATVLGVLKAARLAQEAWSLPSSGRGRSPDPWAVATVGLLHDLAGLSSTAVSRRLHCARAHVGRQLTRHRELLAQPAYAERLAAMAAECFAA